VVGPDAFFLGPLWYYLLTPAYFLFSLDPLGAAIFGAVVGFLTTLGVYLVVKNLFGIKEAFFASLIWSTFPDRVVWNPILIPLCVLLLLWTLVKISEKKAQYIPIAFLIFGLGLQFHFQAIFFIFPIFWAIFLYYIKAN
jgi:4-amino-4-deoxy-L-arabinose transferase-like glycosyltransferase